MTYDCHSVGRVFQNSGAPSSSPPLATGWKATILSPPIARVPCCRVPYPRRQFLATGWSALRFGLLLIDVRLSHADRQRPNAGDHADTLGHADRTARIQNVEQVRALQAEIEGTQDREAASGQHTLFAIRFWLPGRIGIALFAFRFSLFARVTGRRFRPAFTFRQRRVFIQQRLTLRLVQLKMLPRLGDVGALEVVDGKLQLVLQANLAVLHRHVHRDRRPT